MRKRLETTIATMALAGTCFLGLTPTLVMAEDVAAVEVERPEADLTVGVYSQYVWRGWALSDDSLVIQPSMTVGYKGFGFNLWGNLDTAEDDGVDETNSWNETDMTLSYDWSMAGIDYGVGYIYYGLEGDDSQEFYAGLSKEISFITPSFTVYRDTDSFPGWYMSLGLDSSIPLKDDLALDVGFSAGYVIMDEAELDGSDFSDLFDGVISASITFPITEFFTITPEMHYSFPLSSAADDVLEAGNDGFNTDADVFYGGVSASLSF